MAETERTDSSKGQTLPWLVLSGILGMFAVGSPLPTGGPKDSPKATARLDPAAEPHARVPANPLLKPIEEFHASHDDGWHPTDLARDVHGYQTEFLIATVPDPIDSPYGYAFDQVVDAIQRGVQQKDGYLLDRAWLPWEADRRPKTAAAPASPPLAAPVIGHTAPSPTPSEYRETMPGVLVFRHGKDAGKGVNKSSLCIVFLVGETPLGGIHKRAFWECLKLIGASGQAAEPVRVVGPYFTGSQTSLQFLIDDWMRGAASGSWLTGPRPNRFRVITGNASGMRTKEFFKNAWGPERVEIAATVVPARVQLNAVLHFLAGRDGARAADEIPAKATPRSPGRVALLTESNTGFGKHVAAYGDNAEVVVLRFPLHVSRLKSEYAQAFRKKDEQAGLQHAAPVGANAFEDAGGAGEGVPAQGGAATTAANNAVLATILSTISRERFRYVGVVATDTRDKLFLTRLVREHCPDVHVFLTQADLLLTHPDYLYHMKGVVVGSTYPLYAPNQRWVNPGAPELPLLASSAAQGYYNATLALIGAADQMLEYAPPAFAAGPGTPADRPPVWVSMVAPSGSLVPLQVFTGYDDSGGYVWRKPGGFPAPPPTGLRYSAAVYLAGLVLAAAWVWLVAKLWLGRGVWATGGGGGHSPAVGVYRTVLLGAQMVLASAVVAVASARLEHYGTGSVEDLAVLAAAAFAWVLFLGLAVRGVSLRRPADGPAARRWRWNLVNLVVVLGLVAFTAAFLGRFWFHSDRPYRALFFVRATDLSTGLSPLTPLLLMCVAITAGAYFQMERHEVARRCRVPSPFPPEAEGLFDRLCDEDRRLKVDMSPGRFWKRHRVALTALFAGLLVGGVTVWRQSLPTVEGLSWDAAFAVGFWAVYAFAALTLLELLMLWRQTKQLLAVVAELPMMRVFARLPAKVSAVVTKHLYTRGTQPLLLQMTTHQLRLLADAAADPEAPGPVRNLAPLADEAEARLRAFANPARGKVGDPADEAALRDVLSDGAARALRALAPRWKSLPTDEAFGGSPAAATAATSEPAWVGRAEELAATQLVNYLSQYFIQLRSLMLSALVCSSLLLLAATCYPFHPERLLLVFLLGLVGAGVAAVMYVFMDMSRDEAVSRVAKTTPGRLSLDSGVLSPLVTYVLPTLGILTAQLSGTFRWALEPILRVVK